MNVFYEEDGGFKAGIVLADNNTSLQVETQHGKRTKVKTAAVLLRFEHHSLNEFIESAHAAADAIDPGFLWEVCGQNEFSFDSLAKEYFGRQPLPEESAALLMRLHDTPTHFYKKGKGRYKPAPPDALKAALASIERKRAQAERQARYVEELKSFRLPETFRPMLQQLLYKPDRNAIEYKALETASTELRLSSLKLLEQCGALPSSHDYHLGRFLFEYFPGGTGFDPALSARDPDELPLSEAEAFSIDDADTIEIDDAFSVRSLKNGNSMVGIHIAAPVLGIDPGSELDREAAKRLSTVYFPGSKITMLPGPVIERFTLAENRQCPVVSMYVEVTPELQVVALRTQIERIRISANLRHDTLETCFNAEAVAAGQVDFAQGDALLFLHRLAVALERARGKADSGVIRVDYSFNIENDRVRILQRKRGAPIDKVVSEMMILANSEWARMLKEAQLPALFRAQTNGKVRMSTAPAPHQGLGVDQYVWASSPLRRYADLVNQRQIVALARGDEPVFAGADEALLAAMRDFELTYDAYAGFQRQMERYWCLRWLLQEQISLTGAEVLRDDLVRLDRIPLVCRVPSVPQLQPGSRIELAVSQIDLLELTLHCEFQRVQDADTASS
ncbi:MAG: RNB domain-containing ribonuclease [Burkholderiales bacterium]